RRVVWPLVLVGLLAREGVEALGGRLTQVGMCAPGPIEAGAGLAPLVLTPLLEGQSIALGVARAGNERGHAAHRERAPPVARLNQELGVRPHEGDRHRDLCAVRQYHLGPASELLVDAEDVVPASRVETDGVITQL